MEYHIDHKITKIVNKNLLYLLNLIVTKQQKTMINNLLFHRILVNSNVNSMVQIMKLIHKQIKTAMKMID